jgi:hypothetical protein
MFVRSLPDKSGSDVELEVAAAANEAKSTLTPGVNKVFGKYPKPESNVVFVNNELFVYDESFVDNDPFKSDARLGSIYGELDPEGYEEADAEDGEEEFVDALYANDGKDPEEFVDALYANDGKDPEEFADALYANDGKDPE